MDDIGYMLDCSGFVRRVRGHSCHHYQMSVPINSDKLEVELDGCVSMRMVALHAEESDSCFLVTVVFRPLLLPWLLLPVLIWSDCFRGSCLSHDLRPKVRKPIPKHHLF